MLQQYYIMLRKRKHNAASTALHYRDVLVREPSKFFLPFKCTTVSLFLVLKAETHENLTVSVSLDFRTSPLSPYELNAALVRHALRRVYQCLVPEGNHSVTALKGH